MEVVTYKTKVGSGRMHHDLAFFAMLIILFNAYCCNASVIVKSNSSFQCNGRLDECLFEEELELELLMNPYVSRMLIDYPRPKTDKPGEPAIACGHAQDPYDVCISKIKNKYNLCVKDSIFKRC
ncbi:hypothetical protein I3842_03G082400 [Carya illinoinensis]|uniref:Uncharacterized protein n=1 Tax=Carya illinoinensis TaxID=32201 RepID=A0A922FHS8_CARIL|nr:hypothetical protein I3842_03G082400 [Carya illinoinensis]